MTTPKQVAASAGTLRVDGRNIFDILRESLYTEPGIVFRELVSNASDAIIKRRFLHQSFAGRVDVTVDPAVGTITINDDGIGMDGDEVVRYINQVAISGTQQFISDFQTDQTIGQFGVGFYSAFMIADVVEVETRSANGSPAVHWLGRADMGWQISPGRRTEVGTSVTLHLDLASPYLAKPSLVVDALRMYYPFPQVPITVCLPDGEVTVGDTEPVWRREASDEEIKAFCRDYFGDGRDPLGWIFVNSSDIGLRGVLFWRDTGGGVESVDGRIDIVSHGVRIENTPIGLVPKFVSLQYGVVECDRLPLVVSRSDVRSDGDNGVPALVTECLSQECAIAMYELATERRKQYERMWLNLGPFVKYGVLTDRLFSSVMARNVIFETFSGDFVTMNEYLERLPERFSGKVFYASDQVAQAQYVSAFRAAGIPGLILEHVIDSPLLQRIELTSQQVFVRLDAEAIRALMVEVPAADAKLASRAVAVFGEVVKRRLEGASIEAVSLVSDEPAVMLTVQESIRRIDEMRRVSGLVTGRIDEIGALPKALLVNVRNPLVRRLATAQIGIEAAEQLVDLALLGEDALSPSELVEFVRRSERLLLACLDNVGSQQQGACDE